MDDERRPCVDHRLDIVEASTPHRLDPVERRQRIAEAQDFARRTRHDPHAAANPGELEALLADNPGLRRMRCGDMVAPKGVYEGQPRPAAVVLALAVLDEAVALIVCRPVGEDEVPT